MEVERLPRARPEPRALPNVPNGVFGSADAGAEVSAVGAGADEAGIGAGSLGADAGVPGISVSDMLLLFMGLYRLTASIAGTFIIDKLPAEPAGRRAQRKQESP